jgi:hexosaminidase
LTIAVRCSESDVEEKGEGKKKMQGRGQRAFEFAAGPGKVEPQKEELMRRIFIFCLLAIGLFACRARLEPPPAAPVAALVPQPLQVTPAAGRHVFRPAEEFMSLDLQAGEADRRQAARLLGDFRKLLRSLGRVDAGGPSPLPGDPNSPFVEFSIDPGEAVQLGDEGYALRITGSEVRLRAARPAGLFYGVQTLRQLLLERLDERGRPRLPLSLPCLEIVDKPRYAWRGFMLDCCRHFFPKEFIKKCLDEMALFKLNRFHWHLTDDQAWRVEIKKHPGLTARGAFRDEGGRRYGGFYTQDDIREIVAYAATRFITVVPEIEMPGHATAALSVYPGFSCTGGPFAAMAQWGVFADVYCAGNDDTFTFLREVLDEVVDLFPGPWVHIGGDECSKERWNACPKCQARLRTEGLADAGQLQSWFIRCVEEHLNARGKRLIGWDEILEGGLAPEATVMSWRGMEGGVAAARQGHDVVMAPTSSVYLDYYQGDPRFEPPAIGGFLPLRTVYAFEPTPADLNEQEAAHILGGQANLWSEYIATPDHAAYMMWPRLGALAEAVWSAPAGRDWDSFLLRLGKLRRGLEFLGLPPADTTWRPVIHAAAQPATRSWRVEMTCGLPGAAIRYTRDNSEPGPRSRLYHAPFTCRSGGGIRAALFRGREPLGPAVGFLLAEHLAVFAPVKLSASGKLRPEAGGEGLLVDGISGSLNNKDGSWLGVEGGDLEAVIDLGRRREVSRVAARFLAHPAAWIFLPVKVEAAVSVDGRVWTSSVSSDWPFDGDLTVLNSREADAHFLPLPVRYVRLTARSIGACPPGHTGAGNKAWLFVDEVVVE